MRRFVLVLFGAALVALAGCGGSGKYVPVSGIVTLNGQPAAGVMVTFQPLATKGNDAGGVGSFATTDAEGRFTLEVMSEKPQPGAMVGKHRVRIATPPPKGSDSDAAKNDKTPGPFVDPIPARYNIESTLEFDVPTGGTNSAKFELTSP